VKHELLRNKPPARGRLFIELWHYLSVPSVRMGSVQWHNPFPEKASQILQPPRPKCGLPMRLMTLSKFDEAHHIRTFKRHVCA
jgi:hypothetical protein